MGKIPAQSHVRLGVFFRKSPKAVGRERIKFNNAFTSTLAILAALDTNLVANVGLRKYSPSFIGTSAVWPSVDGATCKQMVTARWCS